MAKRPGIYVYDGDWVKDNVAGCSLGAQGLLLRMMFIGHNSERYGYLQQNGAAIPLESIARRCGCTPDEYATLMQELDAAAVLSRTPTGIIFSRRMVRDEAERVEATNRKKKQRDKEKESQECHINVTPVSEEEREIEIEKEVEVEFKLRKPTDSELIYSEYPRKVGRRKALDSIDSAIKRLMSGESKVQMNRDDATVFLIQRVSLFAKSDAGQRGEFTPHPATWFNRSGYLDEESEWQKRDGNGKPSSIAVIRERRPLEQLVRAAENAAKVESGSRHDVRRDS